MLKRLPIALAGTKDGNASEKLTKWSMSNNAFFLPNKRNHQQSIMNIMKTI